MLIYVLYVAPMVVDLLIGCQARKKIKNLRKIWKRCDTFKLIVLDKYVRYTLRQGGAGRATVLPLSAQVDFLGL